MGEAIVRRETQYVDGLQMVFPDYDAGVTFLKKFMEERFYSKAVRGGKDLGLHKTRASLYRCKTGLVVCWCDDDHKKGWSGEINVTIPYILVDDVKRVYDGEPDLETFVRKYWGGNPAPVTSKRRKTVKTSAGQFPKLLAHMVSQMLVSAEMGVSLDGFLDKYGTEEQTSIIPDYAMPIWIARYVAGVLKETETYYKFLDEVNQRTEKLALHTIDYETAIVWVKKEHLNVYEFLKNRGYINLTNEEEK